MKFIKNISIRVGTLGTAMGKYKQSYGDQMIRTFVKSKFAKNKINTLFIMFCTIILRNILSIIFCLAFTTNDYYFDFFIHSFISILCLFSSTFIYDGLMGKKDKFYAITRHYINAFTPKRYRRWKRNIILPIALSSIGYTYIHEITSTEVRYLIMQSLFIYFIMDLIEHNKLQFVTNYFYEISSGPKQHIKKNVEIEHGFMVMNKHELNLRRRIKNEKPIEADNLPLQPPQQLNIHKSFMQDIHTSDIPTLELSHTDTHAVKSPTDHISNTINCISDTNIDDIGDNNYSESESEEVDTDNELVSTYEDISTMISDEEDN